MRSAKLSAAIFGMLALGGCAVTPPTGPAIVALPAQGKNLAQFQQEDIACRGYAAQQIGIAPAQAAAESATTSAVAGTVVGAAAGALIGAAAGNPAAGAAIGGGTGLLVGSAAGVNAATASAAGLQRSYDITYAQCMTAGGNTISTPLAAGYGYPAYPYPYGYPYPYYADPWFWGPPFAFGGAFFFGGHHHHHRG
jgi:hypothetical protein